MIQGSAVLDLRIAKTEETWFVFVDHNTERICNRGMKPRKARQITLK